MAEGLALKPIPIRTPLPWALGRLWTLRGRGMVVLNLPGRERLIVLADGDPRGVWMRADDPILRDFETVQTFYSLQPRFPEFPAAEARQYLKPFLEELQARVEPELWRTMVRRTVRDSLLHVVEEAEWWMFPHDFRLDLQHAVPLPCILWDFAHEAGSSYHEYAAALELRHEEFMDSWEQLRSDPRVPREFRRGVIEGIKFLPGQPPETPAERMFLSYFIPPKPRRAPRKAAPQSRTDSPAPLKDAGTTPAAGSSEEPVFLEEYLERWDYLSAFSYQSQRWTHYRVLGLTPEADAEEIKKRYRILSRKFHPDAWGELPENQKTVLDTLFARLQQAYEILSDPDRREHYDRTLKEEGVQVLERRRGYVDPKLAAEYLKKGFAALAGGRYSEAVKWMKSSLQIQPEPQVEAFIAALESYDAKLKKQAMNRFETLTEKHPDDPLVWWLFGDALMRWGFQSKARKALNRAKALDADLCRKLGEPTKTPLHRNRILMRTMMWIAGLTSPI